MKASETDMNRPGVPPTGAPRHLPHEGGGKP